MDVSTFFLTALFGILPNYLWFYIWQKSARGMFSTYYQVPQGIQAASEHVMRNRLVGNNLYYGVTPCHKDCGSSNRPKQNESAGLVCMWLDVDVKHPCHKKNNLPPDVYAVWQLISLIELMPSLIVASGHGIHAYWLFREILLNTPETAPFIQALLRGWKERFQGNPWGYAVDNVFETARVLRIPGTWNCKPGQEPVSVELLTSYPGMEFSVEGLAQIPRYSYEECARTLGLIR